MLKLQTFCVLKVHCQREQLERFESEYMTDWSSICFEKVLPTPDHLSEKDGDPDNRVPSSAEGWRLDNWGIDVPFQFHSSSNCRRIEGLREFHFALAFNCPGIPTGIVDQLNKIFGEGSFSLLYARAAKIKPHRVAETGEYHSHGLTTSPDAIDTEFLLAEVFAYINK